MAYDAYLGYNNFISEGCIMPKIYKERIDIKDIIGQKFGDLTAIKKVKEGKYRGAYWLCKCDCGNECIAYGGHLRAEKRKSCGCRSQSRIFETGVNRLFSGYRNKAKYRNKLFSLSREKFKKLIIGDCYYCGRSPHQELKRIKTKLLQIQYNGIDRYNPDNGYTDENCVSCCYYCNHSKLDLTFEQWMSHVKRLITHQGISNGI